MSGSDANEPFLSFAKSLGYTCSRNRNLIQIDQKTLAFVSGNFVHFFDVATREIVSRRSNNNAGIACLTKHPVLHHLTVAEYGSPSTVFIYDEYPSLQIIARCPSESSLSRIYCMAYDATGDLLATQESAPTHTLTIWDWSTSTRILRARCRADPTNVIQFSQFNRNCLVTGSVQHIRFWDLSHTFTGPKLEYDDGRFAKFDECDVMAICTMNDDRTLTNCGGGNILVWENGSVTTEVCQKNRRSCHQRTISQISCQGDRVMTVGLDGFVRIWFWDAIAAMRKPSDENYLEIDATYEYEIVCDGVRCAIRSMVRYSTADNRWFAQDANGGIWMCDLHMDTDSCQSKSLFRCHAGAIVDVAACPIPELNYVVSLGDEGRLCVYDLAESKMIFWRAFCAAGRSMVWMSVADKRLLVVGFADGVIRVVAIDEKSQKLNLIHVSKPHQMPITKIALSPKENILVTAAEDRTIFLYRINNPFGLTPIGLLRIPSVAVDFSWRPNHNDCVVFVGCLNGKILMISIPDDLQASHDSYELNAATLIREIDLPCSVHDAETNATANVHWLRFVTDTILWISTSDSALLSFNCITQSPVILIHKFDVAGAAVQACLTHDRKFIIFGMASGCIRVNQLSSDDLPQFVEIQSLQMHDNENGSITSLALSSMQFKFFSAGSDGNLFVYGVLSRNSEHSKPSDVTNVALIDYKEIENICDPNCLSLEQEKLKMIALANAERVNQDKSNILEKINLLRMEFEMAYERNSRLPVQIRLSGEQFEIDPRITEDIQNAIARDMERDRIEYQAEMDRIQSKWRQVNAVLLDNVECWAISLFAIRTDESVEMFFIEKNSDHFAIVYDEFEKRRTELENLSSSTQPESDEREHVSVEPLANVASVPLAVELSPMSPSAQHLIAFSEKAALDVQTQRLLNKYKERKRQSMEREQKWQHILSMKPYPNVIDSIEIGSFEQARNSIGDFALKSDPENVTFDRQPEHSTMVKYLELKRVRDDMRQTKREFNRMVLAAREQKLSLCDNIKKQLKKLRAIQVEIPANNIRTIDAEPSIDEDVELLDHKFELAAAIVAGDTPTLSKNESEEADVQSDFYQTILQMKAALVSPSMLNGIENELRQIRLIWKIFEQNTIIDDINERIAKFDEHLLELKNRRLDVSLEVNFMDLHYLTVYQELMVLRNFEKSQVILMQDIDVGRGERDRIEAKIQSERAVLCELQKQKSDSSEALNDNEHNLPNDDPEELMCDDSGSGNEGVKSVPPDRMQPQPTMVATANENIIQLTENLELVHKDVQGNEYALKMLLCDKHRQLNNVDAIIVLRKDQLQQKNEGDTEDDYVVVNNDKITKLYERIEHLALETAEEEASERFYINQLAKMKSECTAATKTISTAASRVTSAMIRKFGQEIDLDEMEESILSRLLLTDNGNSNTSGLHTNSIRELRKRSVDREKELWRLKQTNVEKFNLLTELQEEKNIIEYQLRLQERLRAKRAPDQKQPQEDKDLRRLRNICRQQQQQLKSIDKEIQSLRMKANPMESRRRVDVISRRAPHFESETFENIVNVTAAESPLHSTESASTDSSSSRLEDAINDVRKCVTRFLKRHFTLPVDDTRLNVYATEISAYFMKQLNVRQQSNELLRQTIENLRNFVPKAALHHIDATEYLQLYADIRYALPTGRGDDVISYSILELLQSIFDEVVNAIPPSIDDYSNFLLIEFLREVFVVLPLTDKQKMEEVRKFMGSFKHQRRFIVADIEPDRSAAQLWIHKDTFMTHKIDERKFFRLVTHLIDQIKI